MPAAAAAIEKRGIPANTPNKLNQFKQTKTLKRKFLIEKQKQTQMKLRLKSKVTQGQSKTYIKQLKH